MKRSIKELTSFSEWERERLKDPEFARMAKQVEHEFLLADSLISLRKKKNLSQEDLAKKIGSKQPVISRLESGTSKPSISLLERVAQALNATLEVRLVE
ncbi:MAG: helix-turn-helix transcriptional regulator [bacterium]|nr:helix-turn-helix transcriptional regulator [bacterium]